MKGRITTSAGEPLPGIEVWADNTLFNYSYLYGTTDEEGFYRIDLPQEVTTWRVGAEVETVYHDDFYRISLETQQSAFASSDGAVRDMVWRLSGRHAFNPQEVHGESIFLNEDNSSSDEYVEDLTQLEVTFTPTGPLIDGSTIEPFTRSPLPGEGYYVSDVPIGHYSVTMRLVPDGGPAIDLLVRLDNDYEYAASVETLIPGDESATGTTRGNLQFEFRRP